MYHANNEAMQHMASASPEQQKAGMECWMKCAQKCGDKLVDMGTPLIGGLSLGTNGASKNSTKEVTGYSVLQANDMMEAVSLLQGHPHLGMGGHVLLKFMKPC
jgi:hypothetical protein